MAAKRYGPVHCRICGKPINRNIGIEGEDWISPVRNFFYHPKCYNDWAKKKDQVHADATEKEWYQSLLYYLGNVLKAPIDHKKVRSQWNNFVKQKTKTPKGIYFSIKYFYDIQKADVKKCQGGIGIVSNIYEEACTYWAEQETREAGLLEKLEQQALNFSDQLKNCEVIKRTREDKDKAADEKFFAALAALREEEDDEE